MITPSKAYLLIILAHVNNFSILFMSILIVIAGMGILGHCLFMEEDGNGLNQKGWKIIKVWLIFFSISIMGCVFCPSFKESCAIYLIPAIANNQSIKELPPKMINYLDRLLDKNK